MRRAIVLVSLATLTGCSGSVAPAPRSDASSPAPAPPTFDAGGGGPDAAPASAAADGAAPADAAAPDLARDRPDATVGAPGPWAAQIHPSLVEISQAVFIKLGDAASVVAPPDRNATMIEGRPAFLRVHVAVDPGFTARPLRAVLTVEEADGARMPLEDRKTIARGSAPDQLDSTFNFLVPAALIKPGAAIAAALYDDDAPEGPEPAAPPRFPRSGSADLAVQAGPMDMEVVLMIVRGPSGPLDDSPPRRQRLERYLSDVYPAQKMTIRWRDPVTITALLDSSRAFQMMQAARRQDGASPGAYYHMLIAVEDSVDKFLGLGSLAGARPGDAANRIAMTMVTGHQVDSQMDTVSHEMGHNLGRNHAPGCNAQGTDGKFPYANTGVGVDGYSLGEMAAGVPHLPNAPGPWKSKAKFKDVMGYCYPTWISDYTWNALAERIRIVSEFSNVTAEQQEERSLRGYYAPRGPVRFSVVGGDLVPSETPLTPTRHARLTLASGAHRLTPITVGRLLSPAGPEDRARVVSVPLPATDEVTRVDIVVDGEQLVARAGDLQ